MSLFSSTTTFATSSAAVAVTFVFVIDLFAVDERHGIAQSLLFSVDFQYSELVTSLVKIGGVPVDTNMTFLQSSTAGQLNLQLCYDIPHGQPVYPCTTMYDSRINNPRFSGQITSEELPTVHSFGDWMQGVNITQIIPSNNSTTVVPIKVTTADGKSVTLTRECVRNLLYPYQILLNLRREDIAWICLQFWLLAISFNAILNDSVPHILAVLMTRTLATAWAMYAIWRGPFFKGNFHEILADPGTPCSLDLFDTFWERRQGFEIADLVLSGTSLIFFVGISMRLLKQYNEQSFKVVGAPPHIMRLHKFFMAVLACLQMEAFVLVTAMGLWVDILVNTYIAKFSEHTAVYEALIICTTILLIPWIAMGWYSIRREMRRLMVVYLAIGFALFSGWVIMFYSIVYRWSFVQWPYLGCFTVAALLILIASLVLGVICRINFGKGLAHFRKPILSLYPHIKLNSLPTSPLSVHAESTLQSLNFAPDSFVVNVNESDVKEKRMSKDSKDFIDFDEPKAPVLVYFTSSAGGKRGSRMPGWV
ncbi:hypothetical protein CVT24_008251 [Panaeolus cyanescens]|uniref:Uncharacterized protein n=1 Tax=Panaeolus cyanescens TaxID=181874 RepID=A0A409VF94_9AGAR|nr:hypothetical protein CVT24_008251 [Panaeolus cyanescens]